MNMSALKGLGKLSLALLLAAGLNGVALAGVAPVEGSAAMKSPANNAAVVAKLIGLVNNRHEKTMLGLERTINDGIVIRQSLHQGRKDHHSLRRSVYHGPFQQLVSLR